MPHLRRTRSKAFWNALPGFSVHGGRAIAQLLEFHPLHTPLMDDRKELVLEIGPRAVELIHEDYLCVPDRRRRGDVA